MADEYVSLGVELDPDVLAQEGFDIMQARFPGWTPNEAAPDTVLIEVGANQAADVGFLLSTVADSVFRFFGQSLMGIPQVEALPATVSSTWTARDTLGHTIAQGTQVQVQDAGGDWIAFEVVDDVVIAAASSTTAAGAVELRAIEPGTAGNGLSGSAESIDALSWLNTVTLVGASSGGADAETNDEYQSRLVRRLRLMAPRPVLAADFAEFALDIPGVGRALGKDNYNPDHNLLLANQSNAETDTAGWNSGATSNCSFARSTTQARSGTGSFRLSSTAAGDMSATSDTGTNGRPVSPYEQYTVTAYGRAGASARTIKVAIRWYDGAGVFLSEVVGAGVVDATANFNTRASVTAIAPATAAFMAVKVMVLATGGAAELHYFDELMVQEGSNVGAPWIVGGTPATGNAATVSIAVADANGGAVSAPTKAAVVDYLSDLRETGFLVHAIDPSVNTIDIGYTVKLADNADEPAVLATIDAALEDYLSPANWGVPVDRTSTQWVYAPKVRLFELGTVINNIGGVDYVASLTINGSAADATLHGAAPVTTPGTITGSAI